MITPELSELLIDVNNLRKNSRYDIDDKKGFLDSFSSGLMKKYLSGLEESEPEAQLRATLLNRESSLFSYIFGEKILTETHSTVSRQRSIDNVAEFENGGRVGIEIKPFFEAGLDKKKTKIILKKVSLKRKSKESEVVKQIRKYLFSPNITKEYVVLTNLDEIYFYSKSTVITQSENECKPFCKKDFAEFIAEFRRVEFLPDYIDRIEEAAPKKQLDEIFLKDLRKWVNTIITLNFRSEISEAQKVECAINLINKFIFIHTLDLFWIVERDKIFKLWQSYNAYFNRKSEYLKRFLTEIFRFFWDFYDTELFSEGKKGEEGTEEFLNIFIQTETNINRLFNGIKEIIGISGTSIQRGIVQYDFRKIDVDVFGKAYETFLAERRKEKGVYYTPSFITDYIVETTVGVLFDEIIYSFFKAIQDAEYQKAELLVNKLVSIRVLDPACGSGSFLIKVFRHIWKRYERIVNFLEGVKREEIETLDDFFEAPEHLPNKDQILHILGAQDSDVKLLLMKVALRHIFGNDFDKNALEVAKLNLLIEIVKTSPKSYKPINITNNHILPFLKQNFTRSDFLVSLPIDKIISFLFENFIEEIKSLNSIHKEFLRNPNQVRLMDKMLKIQQYLVEKVKEELKTDAYFEEDPKYLPFLPPIFYWFNYFDEEGQPLEKTLFGFDIVLGNPPYVNLRNMEEEYKEFLLPYLEKFNVHTGYNDQFYYFIENALVTAKESGKVCFITTNYYFQNTFAENVREYITRNSSIKSLLDFKTFKVFPQGIHTAIILAEKEEPSIDTMVNIIQVNEWRNSGKVLIEHIISKISEEGYRDSFIQIFLKNQSELDASGWILSDIDSDQLLKKIEHETVPLISLAEIEKGTSTGLNKVLIITKEKKEEEGIDDFLLKKYLPNSHVQRNLIQYQELYLIYVLDPDDLDHNPNLKKYLTRFKKELSERNEVRAGKHHWTRVERPRNEEFYQVPEKIVTPYRAPYNKFAYDDQQHFGASDTYHIVIREAYKKVNIKYFLAILNSSLMNFYYSFIGKPKGIMKEYFVDPLSKIPIKLLNDDQPEEKQIYENLIQLTDQMITLQKQKWLLFRTFSDLLRNHLFDKDTPFFNFYEDLSSSYKINKGKSVLSPIFNDLGTVRQIFCYQVGSSLIFTIIEDFDTRPKELIKVWFDDPIILNFFELAIIHWISSSRKTKWSKERLSECLLQIKIPRNHLNNEVNVKAIKDLMINLKSIYLEKIETEFSFHFDPSLNYTDLGKETMKLDSAIDTLIYPIYNISEDEIAYIENYLNTHF